jgi:hypothetical protein
MADVAVAAWPRPHFKATEQQTKIFFVCFGKSPLSELPLSRARFGLPEGDGLNHIDVREHLRATSKAWFEGWWSGAFAAVAERDLGPDLALLTTSDVCFSVGLELPDQPDLSPQQSVWGLARWFCERGADVVLDVHAFHFRARQDVYDLDFSGSDVLRDIKLVLEAEPTRDGLHLMHTRGLCKFARPELMCFVDADDAALVGRVMNQVARTLMEGARAEQVRLKLAEGVELSTTASTDVRLLESLGLEAAVMLGRADGAPLAGVGRLGGGPGP